jgi:ubiquitin C-terminal hydrolase
MSLVSSHVVTRLVGTGKRKLKESIRVPQTLDIRALAGSLARPIEGHTSLPPDVALVAGHEDEAAYDLRAVLYHRGGSAHAGHYVADVWDEDAGEWFEFDDTDVVRRTVRSWVM